MPLYDSLVELKKHVLGVMHVKEIQITTCLYGFHILLPVEYYCIV